MRAEVLVRRGVFAIVLGCSGCGGGASPGSSPKPDAGGEPDSFEPLPACPAERVCPRPLDSQAISRTLFFNAVPGGNVELGSGVATSRGIAIPWAASPCCGNGAAASGVVELIEGSSLVVASGHSKSLEREVPPPTFVRGDEIGAIDPSGEFDGAVLIDGVTFTEQRRLTLPLSGSVEAVPAVVAIGQALAALIGPEPRVVFLDATLGERLLDTKLASGPAARLSLTETCHGVLATWVEDREGPLHVVAFDDLGRRRSPVKQHAARFTSLAGAPHAIWDGARVVVTAELELLELDANGDLASRTPTPVQPLAAVGTDQGLLGIASSPVGSAEPGVLLFERGSGVLLEEILTLSTGGDGITGSAVAVGRSVYFATSSYETRDGLVWARVGCTL